MVRLAKLGLFFNFIGSGILLFSIEIINPCEKYGACMGYLVNGKEVVQTVPVLNKTVFVVGIVFLIIGFFLQLKGLSPSKPHFA